MKGGDSVIYTLSLAFNLTLMLLSYQEDSHKTRTWF